MTLSGFFSQKPAYSQTPQVFSQENTIQYQENFNQSNFAGSLVLPDSLHPKDLVVSEDKNIYVVLAQNYREPNPNLPAEYLLSFDSAGILKTIDPIALSGFLYNIGYIKIAAHDKLIMTLPDKNTVICVDIHKLPLGLASATDWSYTDPNFIPQELIILGDYACVGEFSKNLMLIIPINNPGLATYMQPFGGIGTVNKSSLAVWADTLLLVGNMRFPEVSILDVNKKRIIGTIDLNYGDRPGAMVTDQDTLWTVNLPRQSLLKIDLTKQKIITSTALTYNPNSLCLVSEQGNNYIFGASYWDEGTHSGIPFVSGDTLKTTIPLQLRSMPTSIITIPRNSLAETKIAFTQLGKNIVSFFCLGEFLTQIEAEIPGPAIEFKHIIESSQNYSNYAPQGLVITSNFASIVYPEQNGVLFIEPANSTFMGLTQKPLAITFNKNQTRLLVLTNEGMFIQIEVAPGSSNRFKIVGQLQVADTNNKKINKAYLIQEPEGNKQFGAYSTDSLTLDLSLYSPTNYLLQNVLTYGRKSAIAANDTLLCMAGTDTKAQGFAQVWRISEFDYPGEFLAIVPLGKNPSSLCFLDGQHLVAVTGDGLYLVDLNNYSAQPINIASSSYPVQLALTPDKNLFLITFANQTIGAIDTRDLTIKGLVYVRGLIPDLPIYVSGDGKQVLIATRQDEYRFKTISIDEIVSPVSEPEINISQNYPNPFDPSYGTTIRVEFSRDVKSAVIDIYNILGQKVKSLRVEPTAGRHDLRWDGRNDEGQSVASRVYFAQLIVNKRPIKVMKIVAIK